MNELRPCPFCGGAARIRPFRTYIERIHGIGNKFYANCTVCGVDGPGFHFTEADAAESWNTRFTDGNTPRLGRRC